MASFRTLRVATSKEPAVAAVWSFVTLEQPQYAGNTRYDDSEDRYSFDSFVANSRHYATEIRPSGRSP